MGYGIHTNDSLCREVVIAFPWLIREGSVSMGNFGRGDIRLDRRGEMVLNGIVEAGSLVLRKASGSRAGEIAAHRFLDNSAVTHEMIIEGCAERTRKAAQGRVVIAVQDTTEINFRGGTGAGPASVPPETARALVSSFIPFSWSTPGTRQKQRRHHPGIERRLAEGA